jgi:hypothetical protein
MAEEVDEGGLDTIDAPLQPDEQELVTIGELPEEQRRSREADLVAGESGKPVADSEFFTAPVLDDNGNEVKV